MKKINNSFKTLLLLFISIVFLSCSKDEDTSPRPANNIKYLSVIRQDQMPIQDYIYDNAHHVIHQRMLFQQGDTLDAEFVYQTDKISIEKFIYQGNVRIELHYTYDSNNHLVRVDKLPVSDQYFWKIYYNTNGKMDLIETYDNGMLDVKNTFIYSGDNIVEVNEYNYLGNNSWEFEKRYRFTYDQKINPFNKLKIIFSLDFGELAINLSKNNFTRYQRYDGAFNNMNLYFDNSLTYTYDSDNYPTEATVTDVIRGGNRLLSYEY